MEYHFGYNCKYYLPTLKKCRILIDNYRKRPDLVEQKWLNTKDLLVYLNLSNKQLIEQIAKGEIKTKLQKDAKTKDNKIMFQISAPWQWDDCFHVDSGGQCLYFEPHDGHKITCLMELNDLNVPHPNIKNIPSEEAIKTFERRVSEIVKGINNTPNNSPRMRLD